MANLVSLTGPEYTTDTHVNRHVEALMRKLDRINESLDRINVPNDYPGSTIPAEAPERVHALVLLLEKQDFKWRNDENK